MGIVVTDGLGNSFFQFFLHRRRCPPAHLPQDWLSDKRGRDQFVCRYGDETEVCWNDAPKQQEETVYKRSFWTGAPPRAAGCGEAGRRGGE